MSKHGEIYDSVEKIVAKLYILKDSCVGVLNSRKPNPNSFWFQGAEAMLGETVDELEQALRTIESSEEEKSASQRRFKQSLPLKKPKARKRRRVQMPKNESKGIRLSCSNLTHSQQFLILGLRLDTLAGSK